MKELMLHAETLLSTLGHYLGVYRALCWLIKLPGRVAKAYRDLRDFPTRMVEAIAADFVSRVGRAVAVVGLAALFGTALMIFVAARGSTRVG